MTTVPDSAADGNVPDPIKLARIKTAMVSHFERFSTKVTLADLHDAVGEADAAGGFMLTSQACGRMNICWWADASQEFCTAIIELLQSGHACVYPANVITYMFGSRIPRLPLVQRGDDLTVPYLHLHWVPVAFDRVLRTS
jgi:hypothetical protein